MNKKIYLFTLLTLTILFFSTSNTQAYPDDAWYQNSEIVMPPSTPVIIFPVEGGAVFTDDFGDARSGGKVHEAIDLMAPKMTPILAARGGTIVSASLTEPSYGYMISIAGDDGFKYNYLHINNDTPGTDDGNGGLVHAYAPGISRGVTVTQGQVIAYVGDSGNAEDTAPHLHFEIKSHDGTAINPYPYLIAALNLSSYNIDAILAASPNINFDRGLTVKAGA